MSGQREEFRLQHVRVYPSCPLDLWGLLLPSNQVLFVHPTDCLDVEVCSRWSMPFFALCHQLHYPTGLSLAPDAHQSRLILLTLMSSNNHKCSFPGDARYSNSSANRGIGSCGACIVRCSLIYAQSRSTILSGFPKHRFIVAS